MRCVSGSTVVNSNGITNCESKRCWINYVCVVTSTCNLESLALTTMEFETDRPLLRLETMIGFGGKHSSMRAYLNPAVALIFFVCYN